MIRGITYKRCFVQQPIWLGALRVVSVIVIVVCAAVVFGAKAQPTSSQQGVLSIVNSHGVRWKTEKPVAGVVTFTPLDLKSGEVYSVAVYDAQSLNGKQIETWLAEAIAHDLLPPGGAPLNLRVTPKTANYASAGCDYQSGELKLNSGYIAISLDLETARLIRIIGSHHAGLAERYESGMQEIVRTIRDAARREAVASGRGVDIEKVPKTPAGITPGGALIEGIYAGNQLYGEEVINCFRLYLYGNGEFRLTDSQGKEVEFGKGQYKYDSRTGKIEIGRTFTLNNNSFDPDDEFCLYGRDAANKPFIYGRSNRGFSWMTTALRYAGAVDRPSPEAEEKAAQLAEAEAKRYKFVVAPGSGLQQNRIANVLLNNSMVSNGIGFTANPNVYILLTDGTIYHGFPVAPDEWDTSLSRRMEPEKWGRWRREAGKVLAAWRDNPGKFETLEGDLVTPGGKGDTLTGRFGTGESGGSLMGSYWRLWGVTFTADKRFIKDNRGGAGNSTFMQNGGQPAINTVYDDEGSFTSATGENLVVTAERKKNPNANRAGSYTVDGYVLTLRYDDGRVVRQPFFYLGDKRDSVWFEGSLLSLDKDEK